MFIKRCNYFNINDSYILRLQYFEFYMLVSDIAVFVLKRDVKLQPTEFYMY